MMGRMYYSRRITRTQKANRVFCALLAIVGIRGPGKKRVNLGGNQEKVRASVRLARVWTAADKALCCDIADRKELSRALDPSPRRLPTVSIQLSAMNHDAYCAAVDIYDSLCLSRWGCDTNRPTYSLRLSRKSKHPGHTEVLLRLWSYTHS